MAEQNDAAAMAEVMALLESEPPANAAAPAAGILANDIPAFREQLAILVFTGKCKEAIGVNLTHDHVKRLDENDVIKHYKRCEAYVGAKTTETLIDSALALATKALGLAVKFKDADALKNELKSDYIITKELSVLSGELALRCGRMLALANALLITAKHVDFSSDELPPPVTENSAVITGQLVDITQ